jgi:hypothetical protein
MTGNARGRRRYPGRVRVEDHYVYRLILIRDDDDMRV